MGKRLGLVVIGALLLAGCASGEPEAAPTPSESETAGAQVHARSIEVSDATPEPEASEPVDEEARYLEGIKPSWRTALPSDEDLISVALLACDQMRSGTQPFELDLVSGGTVEDNAWHSLRVGATASSTICQDAVPAL